MEDGEVELIHWFSEIPNSEKNLNVGIKGKDLAELYKAGFPVPNGFVITGDAYKYFIEKANVSERIKKLQVKIAEQENESAEPFEEIRALVMDATLPKQLEEAILENYEALNAEKLKTSDASVNTFLKNSTEPTFVAVRASPAKEEENKYEHAINVKGNQRLISAVKRCFASYAKTHGVSETQTPPGIIIQKMIDADKAGIVYGKDPATIQIEAVFGIREGEREDSDVYHVSDSGNISKNVNLKKIATTRNSQGDKITVDLPEDIAQKQVLNDLEIKKIAETAKKIAEHHKSSRKVEFAIEKKELFVLETKPHEIKKQLRQ